MNILPVRSMGRGTRRSLVEGYSRKLLPAYPSTPLRGVPLPIFDGEDAQRLPVSAAPYRAIP